jgi:hypothetical protein
LHINNRLLTLLTRPSETTPMYRLRVAVRSKPVAQGLRDTSRQLNLGRFGSKKIKSGRGVSSYKPSRFRNTMPSNSSTVTCRRIAGLKSRKAFCVRWTLPGCPQPKAHAKSSEHLTTPIVAGQLPRRLRESGVPKRPIKRGDPWKAHLTEGTAMQLQRFSAQ